MSLVWPSTTTLVPGSADLGQAVEQVQQALGAVERLDHDQRGRRLVLVVLDGRLQAALADDGRGAGHAAVAGGVFDQGRRLGASAEGVDGDARDHRLAQAAVGDGLVIGRLRRRAGDLGRDVQVAVVIGRPDGDGLRRAGLRRRARGGGLRSARLGSLSLGSLSLRRLSPSLRRARHARLGRLVTRTGRREVGERVFEAAHGRAQRRRGGRAPGIGRARGELVGGVEAEVERIAV
jgi:hypothetical protein